jgi:hypothetical protein
VTNVGRAATGDRDPLSLKNDASSSDSTFPIATQANGSDAADACVDTKYRGVDIFGNDSSVGTKRHTRVAFGNDAVGFIRVRKRKLKDRRARNGMLATASASSYDLVRAVRVNGKPRHAFVLGLGSLKDHECAGGLVWFWVGAVRRMVRRGLAEYQRQRLLAEMARKGARLPTIAQCEIPARIFPAEHDEFVRWLQYRAGEVA